MTLLTQKPMRHEAAELIAICYTSRRPWVVRAGTSWDDAAQKFTPPTEYIAADDEPRRPGYRGWGER